LIAGSDWRTAPTAFFSCGVSPSPTGSPALIAPEFFVATSTVCAGRPAESLSTICARDRFNGRPCLSFAFLSRAAAAETSSMLVCHFRYSECVAPPFLPGAFGSSLPPGIGLPVFGSIPDDRNELRSDCAALRRELRSC
jgi:hypothetical protein